MLNLGRQDVNTFLIFTTNRNDDICMTLGRLNEQFVHWLYEMFVMPDGFIQPTSTLLHITLDDTNQTLVSIRIHKNFQIQ